MLLRPFHLAFAVDDLEAARSFYGDTLGCAEGRSSARWVDFDFYGHQITAHLREDTAERVHNPVDGDAVPIPHFGLVLDMAGWRALRDRLQRAEISFLIGPRIRFEGQPGEQATLFVVDPAGNAVEFKGFADDASIFARQ